MITTKTKAAAWMSLRLAEDDTHGETGKRNGTAGSSLRSGMTSEVDQADEVAE